MVEILRFEQVGYSYDGEREALKQVDVTIHQGEKVALLGNNGAGKSTFFLCANGILKPQKGKVYLEGKEIHWDKQEITELRQKIGLVFQEADSQLIAGTVESEVSFGPMNLKISEDDVRERVEDALGNMGLKTLRKRAPHYLSGGEKKRNEIFQMAMLEPRLSILDETDSGLDIDALRIVAEGVNKLKTPETSTIVITHYQRLLDYIKPDIVHVLYKGRIVKTAGPELALELEDKGYDWIKKEVGE